jgi:crossover junction endodeoxyribonuclease RuvC
MIIGVDPGLTGAIAFLQKQNDGGADYWSLQVCDMPIYEVVRNGKKRHELAEDELIKLVQQHRKSEFPSATGHSDNMAFVEKVASMPGMGAPSVFSFGCQFGQLRMMLACLEIPRTFVTPQAWKKFCGLKHGASKDESRRLACEKFPEYSDLFARKKDDGRAEAALIAWYGAQQVKGHAA